MTEAKAHGKFARSCYYVQITLASWCMLSMSLTAAAEKPPHVHVANRSAGVERANAGNYSPPVLPARAQTTCETPHGSCDVSFTAPVTSGMPCPCVTDRERQVWGKTR
jgi:hypothetical protein